VSDQQDSTPEWGVRVLIAIERLDAKVSSAEERNASHQSWAERNIKDHETRLRTLEQFRWTALGFIAVAGLLGSVITKLLGI
jgi:hypothetical protein